MRAGNFLSMVVSIVATAMCICTTAPAMAADPVTGKECRQCHPSKLQGAVLHGPIAKAGQCEPCHNATGGDHRKQKGLYGPKAPGSKLCYQCHKLLGTEKSVHGPIRNGKCSGCHAPHSSPYKGLLRGEGNNFCLTCHGKIAGPYKFGHKPVQGGSCLDCHVPHQSAEAKLVKVSPSGLCLSCHDKSLATGVSVHKPVATHQCVGCHEAHGAENDKLLKGGAYDPQKNAPFCSQCHKNLSEGKSVHGPIKSGDCGGCHLSHNSRYVKLLRGDGANFCYTCHDSKPFLKKFSHGPIKTGRCLDCHSPHVSKEAKLVKPSTGIFCFECHDKKLGVGKSVHLPVASGDCTGCHVVHSSDSAKLLKPSPVAGGKTVSFCYNCHKNLAQLATVHAPVKEGKCTDCHVVHSSSASNLLKADGSALCFTCHKSAPFSGWKYAHEPVAKGDCMGCHTPHQSVSRKLLKGQSLVCFECHDKSLAAGASIHKPVATGECGKCHAVHGGNSPKLLLKDFPSALHIPYEDGIYAFCFTCHDESGITSRKSSKTGFRNGDLNLHAKHIRGHSCKVCHDMHASGQPKLIRKQLTGPDSFVYTTTFSATATGGTCATNCHETKTYRR